jgi:hypothetical protein
MSGAKSRSGLAKEFIVERAVLTKVLIVGEGAEGLAEW